ncbi:MAG TPA: adenylate/guanylate cyclase domain-containing protein, partial [Chitinophagaceae bacterium]|nr:adenylate/guanylate cyclase domain-containing protein [Chitinophagaceae bacterium]
MAIKNQLTNERAYTLITKASIQLTLSADSNCLLSLRQALSLNSKQFDPIVEVNALNSITTYYSYIGSYDSCAWYFNKSTSISRSKGFLFPLQNILLNYSYTLKYQSKISKALEMAFEARNLADSIGSEYLASATDLQISSLYSGMNLYKKALEYLVPAIQVFEKNKINYELAYAYTRVAGLYLVTNDTVRAKRYLDSGEQLSKKNNDMVALSGNYATYAEYYLALNNRVGALQTLKKLVPLDKQLFGNNGEANAAVRLGLCMKESSDSELIAAGLSPIHAEQQILEYMKLGIRYADISKQRDAFKYLSEYYDRHGNMLLAFEHYKKYVLLNDSLQESQSKDQFLKLQTEFDEKNRAKERSLMTKNQQLQKQEIERQRLLRNFFIGGFILMCLFSIVFFRQRNRIKMEMGKSENLLLNILPAEIAHELKEFGTAEARHFNEVSVLFTDFKNFSTIAEQLTPSELVQKIDSYFKEFDRICMSMGIEKIKTIGDSYMCVAGLPLPDPMHAE